MKGTLYAIRKNGTFEIAERNITLRQAKKIVKKIKSMCEHANELCPEQPIDDCIWEFANNKTRIYLEG